MVEQSETPGFLFYRSYSISKLSACGSIEYIHANWPLYQFPFAREVNVCHMKLLCMSCHLSAVIHVESCIQVSNSRILNSLQA